MKYTSSKALSTTPTVKGSNGAPLTFEFDRTEDGHVVHQSVAIKPIKESEKGPGGESPPQWVVGVLPRGDAVIHHSNPISAFGQSIVETGRMTGLLVVGIAKLVGGSTPLRQALGGPARRWR